MLDHLLSSGISNTVICFERLKQLGYAGGHTTVKCYIRQHKHLIPAKRKQTAPQGNRGRRYCTSPGEAYQMDWGFVYVTTDYGIVIKCACFAMICHHCGQCYIEFLIYLIITKQPRKNPRLLRKIRIYMPYNYSLSSLIIIIRDKYHVGSNKDIPHRTLYSIRRQLHF